ncbi:olfactory receptor 5V1-like [Varanus komodoensis]|uniref:olfactory receptor 5V1-like n=1 Tax=Varanus komodoensis TaxID=61221 RepID=UPI001CF7690D|nr:olfactory receptor 5V1-like [Varanus komodoensis]
MNFSSSENQTSVMEFIFLGFRNIKEGRSVLTILFLTMYVICFLGNSLIITVSVLNQSLHTPMYFFLRNLSFLDISYISVTVPKMLADLWIPCPGISFMGCAAQLYFLVALVGTEGFLLASMALDRYFAISRPLVYGRLMNEWTCLLLAATSWTCGFLNASLHTALTFQLSFCRSHGINHFFCDIPPLLSISCSDTTRNEIALFILGVFVGLIPFFFILISYAFILHAIVSNWEKGQQHRGFSTCASHLTVVILFYGSAAFTYFRPTSSYSLEKDQLVGILYNILTPTLNPIIYSLRNKEVKMAVKKLISEKIFVHRI